jgi:uncharacterized protein
VQPGGSVEHWNEEAGRGLDEAAHRTLCRQIGLAESGPTASLWNYTHSTGLIGKLMGGRMYPLTLEGLERAIRVLAR